jgi:hypothetical protein
MSIRWPVVASLLVALPTPLQAQVSPPGGIPSVFDRELAQELDRKQRCLTAPTASDCTRLPPPPGASVPQVPSKPASPLRSCMSGTDTNCDMSVLRFCSHANDINCRQGIIPTTPRRCVGENDSGCVR